MNIAYIFDTFPQWSEAFLQREIDALMTRGFEVEMWAMQARAPAQQLLLRHPWKKYLGPAGFYRNVGRALAAQWKDVDHVHATRADFCAEIAMAAAKSAGITWSFAARAHDLRVRPQLLAKKMAAAAFVTARTRQQTAFLQASYPAQAAKVLLAPPGVPLHEFPFASHQQFYPPLRVLAVGRLVEKKGFAYLLRALHLLQQRDFCPETTILGDGPQRRPLEKLASELKLTHLHFEGAVPPAKVRAHMQRASVLVAPSVVEKRVAGTNDDHDGVPHVLLEAAALGVPILTTAVGGARELITDATGWLCAPRDAVALAEALDYLFHHPQRVFTKTAMARQAIERHYDLDRTIDVLPAALERCR